MVCHALLQEIFPTQGSNPHLFTSPALAGKFFTASATWEAPRPLVLWNENISCHINKQEMSQPSVISGFLMWMRAPKTVIQRMLPPLLGLLRSWENTRSSHLPILTVNKETGFGPQTAKAHIHRKKLNEPRGLHLPIHRILNFLTWDIWLPLLKYNFFDVKTPCSLLQNFYKSWLLPTHPQSSFLRDTEMLSPGLGVLNIPIKWNNSLLSDYGFIFLVDSEVKWSESCSVMSDSLFSRPETGVDSHSLLQGIFPTQGLKPGLLHCRQILHQLWCWWLVPNCKGLPRWC